MDRQMDGQTPRVITETDFVYTRTQKPNNRVSDIVKIVKNIYFFNLSKDLYLDLWSRSPYVTPF